MSYNYNNGIPTLKDALESTRQFIQTEQEKLMKERNSQKNNQQAKKSSFTEMQIALFVIGLAAAIGLILICIGVYDKREPREDFEDEDSRLSMYRPSRPHDFAISSPIENQNRRTYTEPPARVSYRDETRDENRAHVALYVQPSAPVMNDSDRQIRNSSTIATTSRQIQPIVNDLPPTYEECVGYVIR